MFSEICKRLFLYFTGLLLAQNLISQPSVTAFSPDKGPAGSIVKINGSGFDNNPANNIVYFGTVRAVVSSASTNTLNVIAPSSANYEPVTVTTHGFTAYAEKCFTITFPGAKDYFPPKLFTTTKEFKAGLQPKGSKKHGGNYYTVDLDGDGKPEILSYAVNDSISSVSIYTNVSNQGNLTFAPRIDIDSSAKGLLLSYGDINSDGKPDLILSKGDPDAILIMINVSTPGNIKFNSAVRVNVSENTGVFQVHDIDGDGKADLASCTGYDYASAHVCVLRNTSSGNNISFASAVDINTYTYQRLSFGDLNNDNKTDIIIPSWGYYGDSIYVLQNESTPGNIRFDPEIRFETSPGPIAITIGDLDGDGKADIATADNQGGSFSVLRNTSAGNKINFADIERFNVGRFPQSIAIGDIDGDGKPDVAVSDNNNTGRTITLFKNLSTPGSLEFVNGVDFYIPGGPGLVRVADLDGDGKPEVSTFESGLFICVLLRCRPVEILNQPLDTTICAGTNAAFSINLTGTTKYQWQINKGSGWINLDNSNIYSGITSDTLQINNADDQMNNYWYRCSVINQCDLTVYSDSAQLHITTPLSPSVQINTLSNIACQGEPVTFTALAINGGSAPIFQWQKNHIDVGSNKNVYTDSVLKNGDVITCNIISNAGCLTKNSATSNGIAMTVTNAVIPKVLISSSVNNVCYGTPISFFAQTSNAGTSPHYQWLKNGIYVGSDTSVYTDSTLNNQDTIKCLIKANSRCSINEVASNLFIAKVNPLITSTVSITSSKNGICPQESVNFSATSSNINSVQTYKWQKNGITVGKNSNYYTDSNFAEGDKISCSINLKSEGCFINDTAISNIIIMHLTPNLPGSLNLGADKFLCPNGSITLNAPPTYSTYLWQNNSTNSSLSVNKTGEYYLKVTDACNTAYSDTIIVNPASAPSGFLPADTAVCSYEPITVKAGNVYLNYLWNDNSNSSSIVISNPGIYWLQVTDSNNCKGRDSIVITPKICIEGVYFPSAFTPNNDGLNDIFKPLVYDRLLTYDFEVFNRFGQIVFHSKKIGDGWNGKVKNIIQPQGTFIWVCVYQKEGEPITKKSGTLILLY